MYTLWNNENKKNSGIFFVKSQDKGNENTNYGESQIAINKTEIIIVWGGASNKEY